MALYLGVGVRVSRIEIDQVLRACRINILIEDVALLERKFERSIQFLRWRRAVRDPYVNRSDSDRLAFANLYMRRHFAPAESEIAGHVRVVVSMRLVKALDMSQIVCERLRIEARKRLPHLVPRTLVSARHRDQSIT